ncbi:prolipoprotein diacylglyceryl transferase [Nocardia sp. NPDC058480]|uniref:prolipoprotein diacylglyceryl transferase n=1 Tax=unclassified Nocardia TaxID=2637762 RepID=UPI00365D5C2F
MVAQLMWGIPTHGFFVALGVAVAAVVFVAECRRRAALREESLVAVTGALVGGAIGMRLSSLAETLDPVESWMFGARSVLGGLLGAYVGVLIAKKIIGYRERTGDLFAPAVALGMAVGRIGCLLTEAPGRPTSLPWGIHAPATVPQCPGCVAGVAMHPSFLYEIVFQLAAFGALWWLRERISTPGELFTLYVGAYAIFRFLVEFTRANDTVWLDLTRPQWFLLPGLVLVAVRWSIGYRRGNYDGVLRRKVVA